MIKPNAKPVIITLIYRPPDSKIEFMDILNEYLTKLDTLDKELIVLGDLNCDLSQEKLDCHSKRLVDLFNVNQLTQIIMEPTRITKDHESLVDIIATNRPDKIVKSGALHIGISDHSLVYACSYKSLCS